jgi:hypothetical protein
VGFYFLLDIERESHPSQLCGPSVSCTWSLLMP